MSTLRKILVVDDDPVIGKSFQRVLSNRGYAVVVAKDGPEALRKITEEQYDAVFTDIKMPEMDGIDVAKHIKSTQPWLPVVIVSGFATTENEARARAAGVTTILHKPLTPTMIEDSTRDACIERDAELVVQVIPEAIATVELPKQRHGLLTWVKNVALFFSAPFVGLAYIIALPFVGFGMLAWMGIKALRNDPV